MGEILQYDNLYAGSQSDLVAVEVTVAASQTLSVGQVVALNGSNQVVAMTAESVATTVFGLMADAVVTVANTTQKAVVYKRGEFNERKIKLPDGANATAYKVALADKGIILRSTIKEDQQ